MPAAGHILVKPTSVAQTGAGSSSSIGTNGKVHFASATSLSVNQSFNPDFHNYLIVAQYISTGSGNITFVLRDSESATPGNAITNYTYQSYIADSVNITGARTSATPSFAVASVSGTLTCGTLIYVNRPYVAQATSIRVVSCSDTSSALLYNYGGVHTTEQAYDGFTISVGTGSLTGSLAVYGVRK